MGNPIKCFMVERTRTVRISLRRYKGSATGEKCPGKYGYHDASKVVRDEPYDKNNEGYGDRPGGPFPKGHPDWPKKCDWCPYEFADGDSWQLGGERLYKNSETGELFTLRKAPVGAMWDAYWMSRRGPDGICLVVQTPGGDWMIDYPARGVGQPWHRTGVPPKVTAVPSIMIGSYHGWLRDGFLVEA